MNQIYLILILLIINAESIAKMFKIYNVTSKYSHYDLTAIVVAVFSDKLYMLLLATAIVIVTKIVGFFKKQYEYEVINITSDNTDEINMILSNYLREKNDVDVEYKENTIIIKGTQPDKRQIKPMLNELNRYVKHNGKVSLKSYGLAALTISLSIVALYLSMLSMA